MVWKLKKSKIFPGFQYRPLRKSLIPAPVKSSLVNLGLTSQVGAKWVFFSPEDPGADWSRSWVTHSLFVQVLCSCLHLSSTSLKKENWSGAHFSFPWRLPQDHPRVLYFMTCFFHILLWTNYPWKREKCGNKPLFRTKSSARGSLIPVYHCT